MQKKKKYITPDKTWMTYIITRGERNFLTVRRQSNLKEKVLDGTSKVKYVRTKMI